MTTLEASYQTCRDLNRRYGSTYYWSTALLPRDQRPFVHALYGFCRYADDIVDRFDGTALVERERALTEFGDRFFVDLDKGDSDDAVLKAVVDTTLKLNIDPDCFRRFLRSMHMDFTVNTYADFDALMGYMDGSAAVIGEMMLPVLRPTADALHPARQLGVAFQLTNFLRDVDEDLARNRVYIPQDTLTRFGADPTIREATPEWKAAMKFEVQRTRAIYAEADTGLHLLPDASGRCVRAARRLYGGILDQIEARDYDVFSGRVRVPHWKKLAAAARIVV